MRLTVIGQSGQVARALDRLCRAEGVDARFLSRAEADLADPAAAARALAAVGGDVVINAAAYTAVDKAEDEEDLALRINGTAPGVLAEAARGFGAPFLHISTDYVFDGRATAPLTEEQPVGPQSAYGRTKLAGERDVAAATPDHAILRTSWVFSEDGSNFLRTMLGLRGREALRVVDDQTGSPTPASAIAAALLTMARAFATGTGSPGVFHFAGAPAITWNGFAKAIFKASGGGPRVDAVSTADYGAPAPRPAYSVLDCTAIGAAYGIEQPDWRVEMARIVARTEGGP